jgi:riboflavin synthase
MFTGIVEEIGTIKELEPTSVVIQAKTVLQDIEVKDSIAVDGACLTVTAKGQDWFRVDTMPETQRRTRLASLQAGSPVNLERSLAANARIGGHFVQGHIEAAVPVLSVTEDGIALYMRVALPTALRPYVVPKGFVALNGVSLTTIECTQDWFSLALIPYTREHTNLGLVEPGTLLNIETDMLGKYVVQLACQQV